MWIRRPKDRSHTSPARHGSSSPRPGARPPGRRRRRTAFRARPKRPGSEKSSRKHIGHSLYPAVPMRRSAALPAAYYPPGALPDPGIPACLRGITCMLPTRRDSSCPPRRRCPGCILPSRSSGADLRYATTDPVWDRQRLQHHLLHEREDRGGCPNSQRQSQHRRQRKTR